MRFRRMDIERRLRHDRPRPRDELVRSLSAEVRAARRGGRAPLRAGLALAFTLVLLSALAAVGGLSYASSAVRSSAHAVATSVGLEKPHTTLAARDAVDPASSAKGQYHRRRTPLCKPINKRYTRFVLRHPLSRRVPYLLRHGWRYPIHGRCNF